MEWEIYDGLKQQGPMPEAQVYEIIRAGLPRNAYVRQRGATEWTPIEQLGGFAAALQQRGAVAQWPPPPPPPPPPPLIGAPPPEPLAPPPPGTAFAVSPTTGQPAQRSVRVGGLLLPLSGGLVMLAALFVPFAGVALPMAAIAAAAGVGFVLVVVGGALGVKTVCGLCKAPIARGVQICPSCRASFR